MQRRKRLNWLQQHAVEIVASLGAAIAGVATFAWRASRRMAQTESVIEANSREIAKLTIEIRELECRFEGVTELAVKVAQLEVLVNEMLDRVKTIQTLLMEGRK